MDYSDSLKLASKDHNAKISKQTKGKIVVVNREKAKLTSEMCLPRTLQGVVIPTDLLSDDG